jgi:hypothetical protein
MSIQDLGAIGELIGSVAVLATLIYLAVQIRVARNHLDLMILENRTADVRESFLAVALNDGVLKRQNLRAGSTTPLDLMLRVTRALCSCPRPSDRSVFNDGRFVRTMPRTCSDT